MSQLAKWVERVGGRWRDDALLRNFGWLGLGELVVRLSRLVTAIVLARTLAPLELGLAASAMACFEIVRVFAGNGLTQKVIRATDERLEATCNAAWAIAWLLCGGMLVLHLLIGVGLAVVLDRPQLGLLVAALGAVFLFVPCGVIQGALLLRDGRIQRTPTSQIGALRSLGRTMAHGPKPSSAKSATRILSEAVCVVPIVATVPMRPSRSSRAP